MSRKLRITLVFIFSFAAFGKLWLLLFDPFADLTTGYPKPIIWGAALLEFSLVYVLIARPFQAFIELVLNGSVFLVFSIVSITRLLLGYDSCGCGGAIEVPQWFSAVLSLSLLSWLAIEVRDLSGTKREFRGSGQSLSVIAGWGVCDSFVLPVQI